MPHLLTLAAILAAQLAICFFVGEPERTDALYVALTAGAFGAVLRDVVADRAAAQAAMVRHRVGCGL